MTIPPSESQMRTYFACPTAHFERSRGVSSWANLNPSGPEISRQRSTETSQIVTSLRSASNSASNDVEPDREVHVVVDREALRAVALGRLVVRRAPVARAALDLAHVERRGAAVMAVKGVLLRMIERVAEADGQELDDGPRRSSASHRSEDAAVRGRRERRARPARASAGRAPGSRAPRPWARARAGRRGRRGRGTPCEGSRARRASARARSRASQSSSSDSSAWAEKPLIERTRHLHLADLAVELDRRRARLEVRAERALALVADEQERRAPGRR